MTPEKSAKLKAILAFALVFLLGGAGGYFAGYWHAMDGFGYGRWDGWRARAAGDRGTSRTDRFLSRLERDLNLNPEQSKRAADILRRNHERFVELRREMNPRIQSILNEVRGELRAMMEPSQREHFDEMVKRMEEHHRRWRDRRWGRGPGMMRGGSGGMMQGGPGGPGGPPQP